MVKYWNGTSGDDFKAATKTLGLYWSPWRMSGLGGNDTLIGGGDNDTLWGGTGIDRMEGKDGNDIYYVDNSSDVTVELSGHGYDTVYSTANSYKLSANVEHLSLFAYEAGGLIETAIKGEGNESSNMILGNKLNNYLYGLGGGDFLQGFGGSDLLVGGAGADTLDGGIGNDLLSGHNHSRSAIGDEGSNDWFYGGAGNDILVAGNGNDILFGDLDYVDYPSNISATPVAGNDTLISGTGSKMDNLFGGKGNDTYIIRASDAANVVEYADQGSDRVRPEYNAQQYYVTDNVERVDVIGDVKNVIGHGGQDLLLGNALNNILTGANGDDSLFGLKGNDILFGGNGNDTLYGGDNDDLLYGGAGSDRLYGEANRDRLDAWGMSNNEVDMMQGGAHADVFVLGDHGRGVFYVGYGNSFAAIEDFSKAEGDKLQVRQPDLAQYTLSTGSSVKDPSKVNTSIHYNGDLVAILSDNAAITMADFIAV